MSEKRKTVTTCPECWGTGVLHICGGRCQCSTCAGRGTIVRRPIAEPVVKDSLTTESQTPHCPKCGGSGNMIQKANGEWVCHGTHRLDGPTVDHSSEAGEMVEENKLRRWQDGIRDAILKRYPSASIDGAGCDSGDPLDFTLAEINQGLNYVEKERDEWRDLAGKLAEVLCEYKGTDFEAEGLHAALAAYELKAKEGV